jgi:hypothetical protein
LGRAAGLPVSVADVQRWVDQLPDHCRRELAKGPLQRLSWRSDYCCRCCSVFDEFWKDGRGYSSAVVEYLAEFHHGDSVEAYLRCLLIYLCAGWSGKFRRRESVVI